VCIRSVFNAAKFEETLNSPEFSLRREEFRASHQGKRIVLSVERMDYTKGILHRLEAIDYFLAGPGWTAWTMSDLSSLAYPRVRE